MGLLFSLPVVAVFGLQFGLFVPYLLLPKVHSAQRSAKLAQIEQLGRALLAAPADTSTLLDLLAEHVPQMFLYERIEIRLFAGRTLLHIPGGAPVGGICVSLSFQTVMVVERA